MKPLDIEALDNIILKMISTVEASKNEVIEFTDHAREEYVKLSEELVDIRVELKQLMKDSEEAQVVMKKASNKLATASEHFSTYTNDKIKESYEWANKCQMHLMELRNREHLLILRRNELEIRIRNMNSQIERATKINTQVSVVLNYLNSDFKQVGEYLTSAKEKQEFGLFVIEAQEEEKLRLSREMHDGPAQMLAHLMLRSNIMGRIVEKGDERQIKEELMFMRESIRDTLYEVRKIIYDLRPMALDDLGLNLTLKKYFETTAEYYNLSIDFKSNGEGKLLDKKLEIALFRLAQEAVQNVCKHANATNVYVKLQFRNDKISLLVKDNGIGFDTSCKKENSFGLKGMKERVDLLKGKLEITSIIETGTTIFINIPYTEE